MRDLATEFEAERAHLMAVAYRMLGSWTEAEDAVQETWLRYATALAEPAARAEVRDLRGWLTTTTARICLDVLRSARVRRAAYPGQWLPEPVVEPLDGAVDPLGGIGDSLSGFAPDPAERAVRTDQVGIALLVVLERLSPEQRVAFVLHDVFAVPFAEIARVLDITEAAARQLAARGRRAVATGGTRQPADPAEHRRLVLAFLDAVESGDLDRLLAVLAPDVVFIGDGGGVVPAGRFPIIGANKGAQLALGLARRFRAATRRPRARLVLVNGDLGVQFEGEYRPDLPVRSVMWFTTEQGRITGVFHQLAPDKLTRVPVMGPDEGGWPVPR